MISFDVLGVPAPQGGMRAVSTARGPRQISTGGKNLAPWRDSVSAAAQECLASPFVEAFNGPVKVTVEFRFPMPASRSKKVRAAGTAPKATQPDLDKLQRALGDSLTASGLLRDDALIVHWNASKVETTGWTGATVTIQEAPR